MTMEGSARESDPPRPNTGSTARELGKYRLIASLGSGGQADVFLAAARGPMGLKRLAVVKRLRNDVLGHPEFVTMFLDEARLATRLSHPNVVHTYEVGEESGAYFIAMEYLDGQSLDSVMRSPGGREAITPSMWAAIAS